MQAHRYHDISDEVWEKTPHLSGGKGSVGRLTTNNRQFINTVFRMLRTGSPPVNQHYLKKPMIVDIS